MGRSSLNVVILSLPLLSVRLSVTSRKSFAMLPLTLSKRCLLLLLPPPLRSLMNFPTVRSSPLAMNVSVALRLSSSLPSLEWKHRQQVRPELHHHQVLGSVRHGDGAVVANPGQSTAVAGEADGVDPTPSVLRVGELRHQISHRHPVSPGCGSRFAFDLLDVSGVDADLEVRGAGGEEDVVGVPVQAGHGGLEGLLDVFGHPPVIVLLVVTDRDDLGSAAHSELVLLRAPPDTGCSPVDPEQYQGVFPLAIRLLHPDIGVPVTGAGHNPVGLGSPVYPRHPEVVLVQHGLLGPARPTSASRVESDVLAVVREGQLLPVPGPGVAGDG